MVYREVVYRGEGKRALLKRIKEIEDRGDEKVFLFEIKTYEDSPKI